MKPLVRRSAFALCAVVLAGCPDHNPIGPGGLGADIVIEGVQFTQGIQDADGSVPMVLGSRAAVVNVRLRATSAVSAPSQIVLRLLNSANALVHSDTVVVTSFAATAPSFETPSAQFFVPASLLAAGLKWEVLRDPNGEQPDQSTATDRYPSSGPATLATRTVPLLRIRFVPISLTAHGGVTGNVSSANVAEYLRTLLSTMPLGSYEISYGSTQASDASFGTPPSGGEQAFWTQVLSELDAARVAHATHSDAHWIGVVAPPSGFTFTQYGGFGYIPSSYGSGGNTRTSVLVNVGWFNRPTQSRDLVAHELGHNFGRRHAPCGGPSGLDGSYPVANGTIGIFGHDVYARAEGLTTSAVAVAATTGDVMSYCFPMWSSPYTYSGSLTFRGTTPVPPAQSLRATVLLVRGMVEGSRVELEPAVAMVGSPTAPSGFGSYTLTGLDSAGAVLFRYVTDAVEVDHAAVRHFSVAVPWSERLSRLATIRVAGAGRSAELRAAARAGGGGRPSRSRCHAAAQGRPCARRLPRLGGGGVRPRRPGPGPGDGHGARPGQGAHDPVRRAARGALAGVVRRRRARPTRHGHGSLAPAPRAEARSARCNRALKRALGSVHPRAEASASVRGSQVALRGINARPTWESFAMRAVLLVTAAAVCACAGRARPNPIAPYAGTWQGQLYETGGGTVRLTWTWIQGADSAGTLTIGRDGASVPTRIVVATPDSFVVEATRSANLPLVDANVYNLRFAGRVSGNTMTGTAVGTSPVGSIQQGRIEATRVDGTPRR